MKSIVPGSAEGASEAPEGENPAQREEFTSDNWVLDERAMRNGLHVMTAMLLAVAVGGSFNMDFTTASFNLLLCTIFAVFYFVGFDQVDHWNDFRRQLWVFVLTGVWVMELIVAPVGIYLIFSLYFVLLRAMPDIRGAVSVVFVTLIAIVMQMPGGITLGGVMGPAVSAAVTLAMHYALQTLTRLNREREEAVRELIATRNELAASQHAQGVAAERQRLAHEIHDTVAQGLSSIQMLLHVAESDLQSGDTDKVSRRMETARSTASDSLAEARAMIAALQPPALAETSLSGALERMAEPFAKGSDIDIAVEVDGDGHQLPMKVEATLLRIAQGAVGNVAKHSGATRCRVTVTYADDEVRLDVVDNGRGFDPEEVEGQPAGLGHVGLEAMRKRALELGGELIIESQPGGPTAVTAALPLNLAEEPVEDPTA